MFTLVQSNQMERLAARLAAELSHDCGKVLSPEHILVQSPGMATWLRLEIATRNGIAGALEFPLPSNFIWSLCYALIPGVPKENAFTKEAMTWKLMALLPRLIEAPHFEPLKDYLTQESPLKLFQLAGRIADIFDQYLVYRPDWILAWEQNIDAAPQKPLFSLDSYNKDAPLTINPFANQTEVADNCRWQPILWRALVQYNRDELGHSHWHRANLHAQLVKALHDPATSMHALPSRLFVFGISSLPPQTLEVLHALGCRIPVTMLSLSPCRQYWGDILDPRQRARLALRYSEDKMLPAHWEDTLEVGNPLLAANGKMGRELLDLVFSLPETHLDIDDSEYQTPKDDTLLGRLQADILDMQVAGSPLCATLERYQQQEGKLPLSPTDNSLCLRSCHSPLREVETLHDHLLAMLSGANGSLAPRDIVVMLPDVAAYAPFIDAVFASKRGEHYIPYAIADRGAAQESAIIHGFLTLLDITDSRFGLTEILSLLEVPAVMSRFGLDEEELARLTGWLEQAGVRWGRDAKSRESLGLPAFDKHSWAFGIRRILLGYALGDDADFYQGTLPFSGIEGQQAQCVGKLLDFIEVLDNFARDFSAALSLDKKFELLLTLLTTLFEAEETSIDDIGQIRETLIQTKEMLLQAGELDSLPLEVFKAHLGSKLTESRVGQRFLAGSVNFCTLMPMRSIPFQVVCLLGMNDGVYPRVQHPVGFDLMARTGARRGDRSRRLDDRYLFLEALLSARSQLYISFVGRSERDDSERTPSMLVSELLDCCELSAFIAGAADASLAPRLIQQQPLQPFDVKLFQQVDTSNSATLTTSFAAQWCPANVLAPRPFIDGPLCEAEQHSDKNSEDSDDNTLDIASLIRFFRDPVKFFCQRRLRLDLSLRLDALDDAEPFELNALERYQVQQQMLESALAVDASLEPGTLDNLGERLGGQGLMPMAPFDSLMFRGYCRDLAPLLERSRFLMGDAAAETLSLNLPLQSGITLKGTLEQVFPKGLLVTRPGSAKPKDFIALYLRHLCLCASNRSGFSFLLDVGHFHAMAPIDANAALARLNALYSIYEAAQQQPSTLVPALAMAAAEALIEGDTQAASLEARLKDIWQDANGLGEANEPHQQRLLCFPEDFVSDDFLQRAANLWLPLLVLCHSGKLGELGDFIASPASVAPRYQPTQSLGEQPSIGE